MTDTPHHPYPPYPESPAPIPEADIYAAVRAFVLAYALPGLDPAHVFQGRQNRAALPPDVNEYAVMTITGATRRGTPIETLDLDDPDPENPGILTVKALYEILVRVDFFSDTDAARARAQRLAALTRSSLGAEFFNHRNLSALYAEDVQEHSGKGDSSQFIRRYSTTLHLSAWSGDTMEIPYFNTVTVSRLEDVDEHHKS